jgi:hypothetical protein
MSRHCVSTHLPPLILFGYNVNGRFVTIDFIRSATYYWFCKTLKALLSECKNFYVHLSNTSGFLCMIVEDHSRLSHSNEHQIVCLRHFPLLKPFFSSNAILMFDVCKEKDLLLAGGLVGLLGEWEPSVVD